MPMILIHNWDRRHDATEVRRCAQELRKACLRFEGLGLTEETDVTVCLGSTALDPDPKDPLVILVDLLYERPERTLELRQELAAWLGNVCRIALPWGTNDRMVEVFIRVFNPAVEAAWVG